MKYPKYATTVVGAHSVPDWYESLDRLVAVGQLSMASMADAQYRASQAAILDQEIANNVKSDEIMDALRELDSELERRVRPDQHIGPCKGSRSRESGDVPPL